MARASESPLFAEEYAYDTIPYASYPIFQAAPARLAAIGRLYGLTPPPVETARVLELGCAAGGHIIPLALQYPNAQFLGIDISGVQIREGQARIAALQLTNIELRKQSLTELRDLNDSFDYIISHGLFSWVPENVRRAVLRLSHDCLRTGGLVFVSYNALPGWHLKRVIRDVLVFHTELAPDDAASVTAAREILSYLAPKMAAAYGDVLAQEVLEAQSSEKYFLKHDYLERENQAFTFTDFMNYAHEAGLRYVSDADTAGTLPEGLTRAELRENIGAAATHPLRFEQYLDYLTGRMFRMSILTKALDTAPVPDTAPEHFADLHFRAVPLKLRDTEASADPLHVVLAEIERLRAQDAASFEQFPITVRALEVLLRSGASHPSTYTIASLTQSACGAETPLDNDVLLVRSLVAEMFERRMLHVYAHEIRVGLNTEAPSVSALVRDDARQQRDATTNLFHEKVPLNAVDHALLPLLDGSRTPAQLDAIYAELQADEVIVGLARLTLAEVLASYERVHLLQ